MQILTTNKQYSILKEQTSYVISQEVPKTSFFGWLLNDTEIEKQTVKLDKYFVAVNTISGLRLREITLDMVKESTRSQVPILNFS